MRRLTASLALAALVCACLDVELHAAELKAGDKAPDFTLAGSDGKTYNLKDFAGKQTVVLAWFPKAFTPGCTKECKAFKEQGDAMRKFDVAYFTASCDTAELNQKFAEELSVDYPILSDHDSSVATAYGVVNEERKVPFRWTFYIGEDGKILYIDKDVKTESHGADVAAKLKDLGVPAK
ncbi:MAG: peroxiredoxin [Pirellulales bacterium]|nr:peroxiredoxin [Pirellulales bacterium]